MNSRKGIEEFLSRPRSQTKEVNISEDNIISYIENEWALELEHDQASNQHFRYSSLDSPIFCIGRCRGGDSPYGGPFWADFNYDHWNRPEGWNCYQVIGHTQRENTGSIGIKDHIVCIDSRAIFEYDIITHAIKVSDINTEKVKSEISEKDFEEKFIE